VPSGQIFRIAGEATDAVRAAADYEATLRAVLEPGRTSCDLILLGMGAGRPRRSLFPGLARPRGAGPARGRRGDAGGDRVPAHHADPARDQRRPPRPLLDRGREKARAVAAALRDPASPLPAARVRPRDGVLTWLLDRAAAAALERSRLLNRDGRGPWARSVIPCSDLTMPSWTSVVMPSALARARDLRGPGAGLDQALHFVRGDEELVDAGAPRYRYCCSGAARPRQSTNWSSLARRAAQTPPAVGLGQVVVGSRAGGSSPCTRGRGT